MKKKEYIAVTLLPEHKETLRQLACQSGESMAAEVRRLIRQEGARVGLWPSDQERAGERLGQAPHG